MGQHGCGGGATLRDGSKRHLALFPARTAVAGNRSRRAVPHWAAQRGPGCARATGSPTSAAGVPGLHVGGKSALSLQGVRHNLHSREQLVLWGAERLLHTRSKDRFSSATRLSLSVTRANHHCRNIFDVNEAVEEFRAGEMGKKDEIVVHLFNLAADLFSTET